MDQDQLNTHYKRLASTYNQSFTSSTDDGKKGYTFLGEEGARIYQDLMKLRSSDKLVDLGAGTCVTAGNGLKRGVFQKFLFTNNIFQSSWRGSASCSTPSSAWSQ